MKNFQLNRVTPTEQNQLNAFISNLVLKNKTFHVDDKTINNSSKLTIYDLVECSIVDLQRIGKSLRKMQYEMDPEFNNTDNQDLNGTDINELITGIKLLIKERNFRHQLNELVNYKTDLQNQLNHPASNDEKLKIEKELNNLPSERELIEA